MKTSVGALALALVFGLFLAPGFAALQEGVKLEADGKAIDVQVGHLVPSVVDWNGDGQKDLLVGQFAEGKIRLYLNHGTDAAPAFKADIDDFSYLRAGGEEIRLPAG